MNPGGFHDTEPAPPIGESETIRQLAEVDGVTVSIVQEGRGPESAAVLTETAASEPPSSNIVFLDRRKPPRRIEDTPWKAA